MEEIKNIIHNVIDHLSGQPLNKDQELFVLWETLLEDTEKKHVQLSGLKSGTLYVNVDSSAWLYQMKLKKTRILERIQTEFSDIQKMYIKIGPMT
ncbi:MAG TPA: DciA family protein [Candidatus Omnitrophota bacterium]|jgi:hypothetical protein|nr:DciA family protein [Candidatus Omnitrophota bacterium]HPN55267.1 DciA family protein [Candidatus Omnitrophota bacterium]